MYISSLDKAKNLPEQGRKLAILGSTGSIGKSVLDIVSRNPEKFTVTALAGGGNVGLLAEQANFYRPGIIGVKSSELVNELRSLLATDYDPEIVTGTSGYMQIASLTEADIVVSALMGAVGLHPTMAAVEQGKVLALANKESLVLAGSLLRERCQQTESCILPVDSEHNALFQALEGHDWDECSRLILTASGGPFKDSSREFLEQVTPKQALKHPSWDMGAKITIDSATLMNKGLEVIEACHLFGCDMESIEVIIHPESIIHSLVEYIDGSFLAHMGIPDMRIPISHCLGYPKRTTLQLDRLDLAGMGQLTFQTPDEEKFPCLQLAKTAFEAGDSYPVVLNAANEVAVDLFLQNRIKFLDIGKLNQKALDKHQSTEINDLETIQEVDSWARRVVGEQL
ncbi:MAG: 1-deoxy-D-xylulose-5-phosphate reductoisomerase [Thermodesulfobacteriota bacterium]